MPLMTEGRASQKHALPTMQAEASRAMYTRTSRGGRALGARCRHYSWNLRGHVQTEQAQDGAWDHARWAEGEGGWGNDRGTELACVVACVRPAARYTPKKQVK